MQITGLQQKFNNLWNPLTYFIIYLKSTKEKESGCGLGGKISAKLGPMLQKKKTTTKKLEL